MGGGCGVRWGQRGGGEEGRVLHDRASRAPLLQKMPSVCVAVVIRDLLDVTFYPAEVFAHGGP